MQWPHFPSHLLHVNHTKLLGATVSPWESPVHPIPAFPCVHVSLWVCLFFICSLTQSSPFPEPFWMWEVTVYTRVLRCTYQRYTECFDGHIVKWLLQLRKLKIIFIMWHNYFLCMCACVNSKSTYKLVVCKIIINYSLSDVHLIPGFTSFHVKLELCTFLPAFPHPSRPSMETISPLTFLLFVYIYSICFNVFHTLIQLCNVFESPLFCLISCPPDSSMSWQKARYLS